MKKITILLLSWASFVLCNDIEVSQDTLMQYLNYGESADRTLTLTNNTSSDIDLTISIVDQTWFPPLIEEPFEEGPSLPDVPDVLGFSEEYICGTPDPDPVDLLVTVEQVERWLEQQGRDSRSIVNVQIAWHVIHADNGSGQLSISQIEGQVSWLNAAFADHEFIFTLVSVDYTENNDWFYNMYDLDSQVKYALAIDPVHHMNVYTASIFSDGVAGYAYMPNQWTESSHNHGIVLDYRTLPYAAGYDGDTATHEAGHYLGLHHTFYNDCTTGNDGVDDTPAHHSDYLWQCNSNLDSCPTLPGNDPVHNYMTYTSNSCQNEFTPGQKDRMHAMVATYRPGLLENPVAPEWLTTANGTVTVPANGTVDVTLNFDATSTYGGTYFSDINFASEAPDTSLTVSATLDITGDPEIGIFSSSISFDDAYLNDTSMVSIDISNVGTDHLEISELEFDNTSFFSSASTSSIGPGESEEFTLYFVPDSVGTFSGTLSIQSNDEDDPTVDVSLSGEGIESPLVLSFEALVDTLAPNSVGSHLLTLSNSGSTSMDYEISHGIDWLTITPENGSIPAFNTELVQLNISTLFMNYGEYSGTITIETNVGNFEVLVTIHVAELSLEDGLSSIPERFAVHKNFPNPFNPITEFQIDVPETGHMSITIYDIYGRLINTLYNGTIEPASHRFKWNGKNNVGEGAASGVYILYVHLNGQNRSQKMLLVK